MARDNINDILAFLAVAQERSFTRAAAKLGVSQSALSHTVRGAGDAAGRAAADPHDAQRLAHRSGRTADADGRRRGWRRSRRRSPPSATWATSRPARSASRPSTMSIDTVLWPRLAPVLEQYPDVRVEISADYRMVDIAAERFDIGVRYGDQVQQDMVAVRLTPDMPHDHRRRAALLRDAQGARDACRTWRGTTASRCGWPAAAASMPGSCATASRTSRCACSGQVTFNGAYQMLQRRAERLRPGVPAGGHDAAARGRRAAARA